MRILENLFIFTNDNIIPNYLRSVNVYPTVEASFWKVNVSLTIVFFSKSLHLFNILWALFVWKSSQNLNELSQFFYSNARHGKWNNLSLPS